MSLSETMMAALCLSMYIDINEGVPVPVVVVMVVEKVVATNVLC